MALLRRRVTTKLGFISKFDPIFCFKETAIKRVRLFTTSRFIKAVAILVAMKVNASGSKRKPGLVDFERAVYSTLVNLHFVPK